MSGGNLFALIIIFIANAMALFPQTDDVTTFNLNDKATVITSGAWQNNIIIIRCDNDLALIDSLGSPQMLISALNKAGIAPASRIKTIINTHHHWDHCFGNTAVAGAKFIASSFFHKHWQEAYSSIEKQRQTSVRHIPDYEGELKKTENDHLKAQNLRNTITWLKKVNSHIVNPLIQPRPDIEVSSIVNVDINGTSCILLPLPGMHSPSDLMVFLPQHGVLASGDIFAPDIYPYIEDANNIELWIKAFRIVLKEKENLRYIVPGHGALIDKKEFFLQLQYLVNLQTYISNCLKLNRSLESSLASFDFSPYQGKFKHSFLHQQNFRAIWTALAKRATAQ